MPLTKAALEALHKNFEQATFQHAIVAEERKELAALLEHFPRKGPCNHCLIWKTENPSDAYYRVLKVLADNDDVGLLPLQVAQYALLTARQLETVLDQLALNRIIRYRHGRWFAIGCTCDLPF